MNDHAATVTQAADGTLDFANVDINTKKGYNKPARKLMIDPDEKVENIWNHADKFKDLESISLLLTNACNLSCNYCFEQHNKDFGAFTVDKVRQAWDFLRDINPHYKSEYGPKYIRFLGGEPLIHKNLILQFLREHEEEILSNVGYQTVGMTTNALLMTDDFIDEFYGFPGTLSLISLDTIDASMDNRGIPQNKIDLILDNVEKIIKRVDDPDRIAIRATISPQQAPHIKEFWNELYNRGVKRLSFHPLILSHTEAALQWPDDLWNQFSSDLKDIVLGIPEDIRFTVAEGVGTKGGTNCLVDNVEMSIDASGDFSGCSFFTNRKDGVFEKLMLGNIFDGTIYMDRYNEMRGAYEDLYVQHEECKTCDFLNLCYQCPAGNYAVDGQLFRPDQMCKRFVKIAYDMGNIMTHKKMAINTATFIQNFSDEFVTEKLVELYQKYTTSVYEGEVDRVSVLTALSMAAFNQDLDILVFYKMLCQAYNLPFIPEEKIAPNGCDVDEARIFSVVYTYIMMYNIDKDMKRYD